MNVSMNGPELFNRGALRLCSGAWNCENWQKLHCFIVFRISILGGGSVVWGANHTEVHHGDETESRASQWWRHAWDCSWSLWLKWIKANNIWRVTQRPLKTLVSADDE